MLDKIVLAGGSGYLGQVLVDYYKDKAKQVIILSRSSHDPNGNVSYCSWDGKTAGDWAAQLEGCDLLVNLSGKNVNCRYTPKNREEILSSRLESTSVLGKVIEILKDPPDVWINLASATIYRHAEDRYQDEEHGDIGTGFSVEVCRSWEKTFLDNRTPRTKKLVLRTGIVLGKKDEVLPKLINLVRFGLGGRLGTGQQYVSWIHEHDFARITEFLMVQGKDGEIYNATAPGAIRNEELMRIIRKAYGVNVGLPSPQWLLELGAALIGTETELVLKSRWVYPAKLLASGFRFHFPQADHAIHEILATRF